MKKILILIVILLISSSAWGRWSDNDYSDEEKSAVADVIANDANENGIPDITDATGNPIASEVNVTDANELTDETTVEGWLDELATTVAGIVSFTWDYDYDDLINKPTIPTALSELSGDSDDISEGSTNLYERDTGDNTGDEPDATEDIKGIVELAYSGQNAANVVVQGNDYRMTDTRTPANESITTGKFVQSTLVLESEGIASNDNDTTIPTSAAVKDYGDNAYEPADATILKDADIGVSVLAPDGDGSGLSGIASGIGLYTVTESGVLSAAQLTNSRIEYTGTATATFTLASAADAYALAEGSCIFSFLATYGAYFDPQAGDTIIFWNGSKHEMDAGDKMAMLAPVIGDEFVITPKPNNIWWIKIVSGVAEDAGP